MAFLNGKKKKKCDSKDFDRPALDAINESWSHYDCKLSFDLEHKLSHTSKTIGYWGKGNYVLMTVDGEVVTKIRSAEKRITVEEMRKNRSHDYLVLLVKGQDQFLKANALTPPVTKSVAFLIAFFSKKEER